jgi:hypothetical protein
MNEWMEDSKQHNTEAYCIWLAWSTAMVNIDRYKQYHGSISHGQHRQVSNI